MVKCFGCTEVRGSPGSVFHQSLAGAISPALEGDKQGPPAAIHFNICPAQISLEICAHRVSMMSHRGGDLESELERRVWGVILTKDGPRWVVMEDTMPTSPSYTG